MTKEGLIENLAILEAEYWGLIQKENISRAREPKTPKITQKLDDLENAIRLLKEKLKEVKRGRRKVGVGVV